MAYIKPNIIIPWRFWGSVEELRTFWMKSSLAAIFFNRASKGNPETSGAGGFVSSSNGLVEFSFRWGLGIMSNNQSECYSLLMAIQVAKENGFKSIQVFDDSEMLIKALNSDDCFNNSALNNSLQRIQNLLKEFYLVASFHVLRKLNNLAYALANKACLLPQGFLSINGEANYLHPIP